MAMTPDEWKEAQRPAFEAWYLREYGVCPQACDSTGRYFDTVAGFRWQGWLAAKAEPVEVTPDRIEDGARALYGQRHPVEYWHEVTGDRREGYLINARAILSAALNPVTGTEGENG